MSQINQFQRDCQSAIQRFAKFKGLDCIDRTLPDPLETDKLGIEVRVSQFSFWLYCDGAIASGPKLDKRYEIYDFDSLSDLQSEFLTFAEQLLSRA